MRKRKVHILLYVQRARMVKAGHERYMEVHLGAIRAKLLLGESFSGVARYSESVYS